MRIPVRELKKIGMTMGVKMRAGVDAGRARAQATEDVMVEFAATAGEQLPDGPDLGYWTNVLFLLSTATLAWAECGFPVLRQRIYSPQALWRPPSALMQYRISVHPGSVLASISRVA